MLDKTDPQTPAPRAEKPNFLTQTLFSDFDLSTEVLAGINETGFTHCTPIQSQVLPLSLTGRDVAGQAQTGTGKTAAFLVTIFTRLLQLSNRNPKLPSALIVAPTRELALQIYEEAETLGRHTGLSLAQVLGGVDYRKQAETLRHGADIVICTPGRIIDYFKQGIFKTTGIKIVVIDEADRLFDLGFTKDMRYILRKLPHYEKRQSMLFSATLSYRVMELTYEYMNLPEFISVTPEEVTVEGIEQSLFHIGTENKLSLLLGLLKREDWNRILIFVNTKAGVEWITQKLKRNGWPAEGITGDLPQRKRFRLMERFKDGAIKILVATDVASRGIHVEDISHVINYDLPQDSENYIHRIGRTARAGKTGYAISLACERYVYHLEPLEEMLNDRIPVIWP
ncbi:MAG: DEAD/DEAH box helicase, partial [Deltaproteobacteria bacterium]|nr:DEAD/DEAH box helicase [Deltaproteobacteria bacterium]